MDYIHAVGFICDLIYNELLICRLPSSHLTTCTNERPDIFGNVLDLPTLSVKRNGTESQIIKDIYDVSLGSAGDTNPKIRNVYVDKLLQKLQDFFTSEYQTSCDWTFVEGIDDYIDWCLPWGFQHVFETICQFAVTCMGLLRAATMGLIEFGENGRVDVGLFTKLDQQG